MQGEHIASKVEVGPYARLRPGAVDRDYVNCMKNKGFTVEN